MAGSTVSNTCSVTVSLPSVTEIITTADPCWLAAGLNTISLTTPLTSVTGSIAIESSGKRTGLSVLTERVRKSWGSGSNRVMGKILGVSSVPDITPFSGICPISPIVGRSLMFNIVKSKNIVSESEFSA